MSQSVGYIFLLVIIIGAIAALAGVKLIRYLIDFNRERRYIDSEITRSFGAERQYWIQQRRHLWLSLLPFVHFDEE